MGLFSSSADTTAVTRNTSQGYEDVSGVIVSDRSSYREYNAGAPVIGDDVGAGARVNVTIADAGSIARAFDYAEGVAEANRDAVATALGVAQDAIDAGVGFGRANLEIARSISDDYRGITRESLDFANDIFGQARATIAEITAQSRGALGTALETNARALAGAATEVNTTNDARLNELAQMAFFAVAAVVVLPLIFRR